MDSSGSNTPQEVVAGTSGVNRPESPSTELDRFREMLEAELNLEMPGFASTSRRTDDYTAQRTYFNNLEKNTASMKRERSEDGEASGTSQDPEDTDSNADDSDFEPPEKKCATCDFYNSRLNQRMELAVQTNRQLRAIFISLLETVETPDGNTVSFSSANMVGGVKKKAIIELMNLLLVRSGLPSCPGPLAETFYNDLFMEVEYPRLPTQPFYDH